MLYVPQVGIINPSEMGPDKSIEAVIWVAVGGRGTLVGPIIGAIFVNALRSWATRAFPDLWLIILGLMATLVVLFMPKGLVGLCAQMRGFHKGKKIARSDPNPRRARDPSAKPEARPTHPVPRLIMSKRDFILAAEGVNKSFDGFKAINDLNFYMEEGELRTVIGPNGAGKSTFMDLITGRTKPDTGTITFMGAKELTGMNEYQIYRLGIGRKFQTPTVFLDHTVFENIMLNLEGRRGVWDSIFHRTTQAQKDRIFEVLKIINLADKAGSKAGSLAHGQKQWLEIGMLLAQNAKLLLVDEPAAGMTDEETHKTGELLMGLAGKHSIIVIEHDMVFVRQIAKKVTVLHQGSILCEGTVDAVQNNEKVIEVYLGKKSVRQ